MTKASSLVNDRMLENALRGAQPQQQTMVGMPGPDGGTQQVPVEVAQAMFLSQIAMHLNTIANVLVNQYQGVTFEAAQAQAEADKTEADIEALRRAANGMDTVEEPALD